MSSGFKQDIISSSHCAYVGGQASFHLSSRLRLLSAAPVKRRNVKQVPVMKTKAAIASSDSGEGSWWWWWWSGSFCKSYPSDLRTAERGRLISSRRNRLSSASLQEGVKEPVTLCPLENLNTPENMPANSDNAAPQQRLNRAGTTPLAAALMPGGFFFSPSLSLSLFSGSVSAAVEQQLQPLHT